MPIIKEPGKPTVFDFKNQEPISFQEVLNLCSEAGARDQNGRFRLKGYYSSDTPNGLMIIATPADVKFCVEAHFGRRGFFRSRLSAYPKFTPRD